MTAPDWADIRAIEVEAAAWVAQLDNEAFSQADLTALREWCARSAAHREALRRLGTIWAELDSLVELRAALAAARRVTERPGALRWNTFWATQAAVFAIAVIAIAAWLGPWSPATRGEVPLQMYSTNVGEQRTVVLLDRSTIRLNTNSLVEVDYRSSERRVRLVKGEALFDVARDRTRPFVVYAAADTIRAVGTRFSVRLLDDNVEVVVSEGTVALLRSVADKDVGAPPHPAMLRQKQTAVIDDRAAEPVEINTLDRREIERRLSWATGVLEFDGEPLDKVVAEVSRYTPLHIRIAQPELGRMPVGGRFRVGETQALFDVIEAGFGARVIYAADTILITRD